MLCNRLHRSQNLMKKLKVMPQEKFTKTSLHFRKKIAVFFLLSSTVAFAQEAVPSDTISSNEKEIEQVVIVGYGSVKKPMLLDQ